MRKALLSILLIFAVSGPAAAGPFEDGQAAHARGDYATALSLWRPLAEQGHAFAQTNVGLMYANGEGVPQDYAEAVRFYRLAAEQGDAFAQSNLGVMYVNGYGVPQDYAEAVQWNRLAADQGYAVAQYSLGVAYQDGEGVPQDYAEAVRFYRLAADQGLAEAQYNLGVMYVFGRGVRPDAIQAHMWWSLAAEQGFENAIRNRDTVAGNMTPAQIAEAQRLASAWRPKLLGAPSTAFALPPCPEDPNVRWDNCFGTFTFASGAKYVGEWQNNDFNGQGTYTWADGAKYVGEFKDSLSHGQGTLYAANGTVLKEGAWENDELVRSHQVAVSGPAADPFKDGQAAYARGDYATALRVLRPLAEQGNAGAQLGLGMMNANGWGVPQDDAEAARWWLLAADQGDVFAQFNLGVMFARGTGVPKDFIQAYLWLILAASQGPETGLKNNEAAVKLRDALAEVMSPAQIAEAQRLASAWRPK